MIEVSIIHFSPKDAPESFMVLAHGWGFPETGLSYCYFSSIERAVHLRRKIQNGHVPMERHERAYCLDFEPIRR